MISIPDYGYTDHGETHEGDYIWPVIATHLSGLSGRALDVGCGNGFMTERLRLLGFEAHGVDPSTSGISQAQQAYPSCAFACAEPSPLLGQFDAVICAEVIEHVYDPASLARTLRLLTKPGGVCIVSTPYHGYIKNLALSVLNKWDDHMSPFWHGGHIKLFSVATLTRILREGGFQQISVERVGRIPVLAKSMIAVCR